MLERVSPQHQNRLGQCSSTHGGVVQLETGEPGAEGVDHVDEQLIQGIIAGLPRSRPRPIGRDGGRGGGRLVQAPGNVPPRGGRILKELPEEGRRMVEAQNRFRRDLCE